MKFRKLTNAEFVKYKDFSVKDYASDLIKSKQETQENALSKSIFEFESILPNGMDTNNNYLYMIINNHQEEVGLLWYGNNFEDMSVGFVFDIIIFENFRNQGFGYKTMKLLEEEAFSKQIKYIELNVFKHNRVAYNLYAKLGYMVKEDFDGNMTMRKTL